MDTLGQRIQRIRRDVRPHGTQRQLAEVLGVRQSTVSRWEADKDTPSDEALERLLELTDDYASVAELRYGNSIGSPDHAHSASSAGLPEKQRRPGWLEIDEQGRLQLPSEALEALEVRPGDKVVLDIEGAELRIRSARAVIAEIQAFVRSFVPDDVSLVDELIAERRREAERE